MIDRCRNLFFRFYNAYQNSFAWIKYSFSNYEYVKILKTNKIFKNLFNESRCFILGNGPSLNSVDFTKLSDEYVFTVNQIARRNDFNSLKSNFHFFADTFFYNLDETKEDAEVLDVIKRVKTHDNNPMVFFPINAFEFIKKNGLDKELDIHFFKSELIFGDFFEQDINYSKVVPSFNTVVQWCISMAIYMGFKEIYLLGCDNTGIISTVKSVLKEDVSEYTYDMTDNERKRMQKMLNENTLYEHALSYAYTLKGYSDLKKYCDKRGIRLYNCSNPTVIGSIEKISLDKVLKD